MEKENSYTSELNLIKVNQQEIQTYADKNNPLCIHVIKSGWSNPQLYHVLVEFGDYMDTILQTLEANQIAERYGINVETFDTSKRITLSANDVNVIPNDMELGKKIRSLFNTK